MLNTLGLSSMAEKVYRTILAQPQVNIVGLCQYLKLSESEVRASLDELARFTLLRESRDQPGQLRAVSPEVGLETLLRRQEEELARRQQELAATKTQVAEMVAEYAGLRPAGSGDLAQRLVGLDAIEWQLEILAREVTDECLSLMPGGAQSQASLDSSRPLDSEAMERGVKILTIYQDSVRNDAATYNYARWLTELGGQVRTVPILPIRMLIFDRRVAVIPIDPANTRLGAICTRESGVVLSLAAVFDLIWTSAIPLGAAPGPDPLTGLSAMDTELLKLLGSGLTDEAAGKRLGVSARTVRRQMASLMERLGATSRFEAGLKAAQRGWL